MWRIAILLAPLLACGDEGRCQRELTARGVAFEPTTYVAEKPAARPDLRCQVDSPVLLQPTVRGVSFRSGSDGGLEPLFASCALALAIDQAAGLLQKRSVTEVIHLGTYECRLVEGNSPAAGTISQHGRARAIDLAGFTLAGGSSHTVKAGWEKNQPKPVTPGGIFLRGVAEDMFDGGGFSIVLTPDFNEDHADHFHLDLTENVKLFQ